MTPAGRYYRVFTRFWQDPRVRALSEDGRVLLLYLRTSPHNNMVGLYYCPLVYMLEDLGWGTDEARLAAALEELVSDGHVRYDYESRVVLVADTLVSDPLQNPNQVTGAVAVVRDLVETPLVEALIALAETVCPTLAQELRNGSETLSKPLPNGSETVWGGLANGSETLSKPDSGTGTRSRIPVPDPVHQEEREKPPAAPDPADEVNLTIQEREILQALHGIGGHVPDFKLDLEHVRRWLVRFPQAPILDEIDKCVTWWTGPKAPRQGLKPNWRSRIRNWLQMADDRRKEREKRESARPSGPGGSSRPPGYYDQFTSGGGGDPPGSPG